MSVKKRKMSNCFVTKDYKIFKKTKGNRPVSAAHIGRIKKAIAKKDLKLPILVTDNMEIKANQNTFWDLFYSFKYFKSINDSS